MTTQEKTKSENLIIVTDLTISPMKTSQHGSFDKDVQLHSVTIMISGLLHCEGDDPRKIKHATLACQSTNHEAVTAYNSGDSSKKYKGPKSAADALIEEVLDKNQIISTYKMEIESLKK